MTHSLTLGSLLLTDGFPDSDHGYEFAVLADNTSFGVAAGVDEVVTSLLSDGDLVRRTRYGNREVSFAVQIEGPTLASLAQGEAALRREIGRGNTLVWQPPDTISVPTAFDVVMSSMQQQFDDLDELRTKRTFVVTLTCAAFARSLNKVTVAALAPPPVTPVTVTINNADTTAGWSGSVVLSSGASSVTPTDQGAFTRIETNTSWAYPVASSSIRLDTAAVSMSATPYLLVEASALSSTSSNIDFFATVNGTSKQLPIVSGRATGNGTTVYLLDVGAGSLTSFTMQATYNGGAVGLTRLDVHDVSRTNTIPQVSKRQQTRGIATGGTERTPASIRVAAPDGTTNLGLTILHTSPEDGSGYSPPLRRWRVSGNSVDPDAAMLSGAREPIHPNPVQFEIPTAALPEGAYEICARLRSNTTGVHRVYFSGVTRLPAPNASTLMGPVDSPEPVTFTTAGAWVYASLGVLTLPTVRTAAGKVVIGIQRDEASSATIDLDEAWLFRIGDDCALSVVNVPAPNFWADSPDLRYAVPTAWMGTSMADRVHPGSGLRAMGSHVLRSEGTAVFAATVGVQFAEVSGNFYRRYHSNAAD